MIRSKPIPVWRGGGLTEAMEEDRRVRDARAAAWRREPAGDAPLDGGVCLAASPTVQRHCPDYAFDPNTMDWPPPYPGRCLHRSHDGRCEAERGAIDA